LPTIESERQKRTTFDAGIKEILSTYVALHDKPRRVSMDPMNNFDYNEEDKLVASNGVPEADAVDSAGKLINQQYMTDLLINTEVCVCDLASGLE